MCERMLVARYLLVVAAVVALAAVPSPAREESALRGDTGLSVAAGGLGMPFSLVVGQLESAKGPWSAAVIAGVWASSR